MMNRRNFIRNVSALSTLTILKPNIVFASNNNSAVRIGLVGCGSRARGILGSMAANTNIQITALADIFEDKVTNWLSFANELNSNNGFAAVDKKSCYIGYDSYMRLLENKNIDAVIIASPAYTHPKITEDAVKAGRHLYCEKPISIDAEGCKQVIRTGKNINGRLSAFDGFQIRYATPYVEMAKRIKRGDIGDIVSVQLYYFSSGAEILPHEGMSYDELRIRNHYHFHEISGGCYLDQAIHMIDVCNWILGTNPLYAIGLGGRKGGPDFGNAWTNYQVIYKYPNDINVNVQSSKFGNYFGDVCAKFIGTEGYAEAHYSGGVFINGKNSWDSGIVRSASDLTPESIARGASSSSLDTADLNKGKAFIESIVSGNYINQLESGSNSTLTAILGREAASRQEKITWDELLYSAQEIDHGLNLKQFTAK
ncbi:Gfo/Idh/MocA family protein [Lascolabacillus massiliensis]|jgi:myo-inositol 2-dehydrogenase/D-chiro-inositol 1-dehydrogenase|uniref:Gfo/Idh/MocA family protein n=1 Tax=Lascolabacillus massiliensis TaxID=1627894 RepID=UPI0018D1F2A7|nr:Gfo/Idh/MocA family oxidoreductase [Lascolabacillus massiliensis]MDI9625548.1 Gfo/Idh/MocA family oxidoreductase [Bacteroidota bacterium]